MPDEICLQCGGRLQVIASIEAPAVIDRILAHLGREAAAVDPAHPSRAPPRPDRLIGLALRRLLLPAPPGAWTGASCLKPSPAGISGPNARIRSPERHRHRASFARTTRTTGSPSRQHPFSGRVTCHAASHTAAYTSYRPELQSMLDRIERSMSTGRPDSELSQFSATLSTDWVPTSAELCTVVAAALEISRETGGAFDVTVAPLVNLWGFGPDEAAARPPAAERIAAAMQSVDFARLSIDCYLPEIRKDAHRDLRRPVSVREGLRPRPGRGSAHRERGRDNRLVGQISRRDVLRALTTLSTHERRPAAVRAEVIGHNFAVAT